MYIANRWHTLLISAAIHQRITPCMMVEEVNNSFVHWILLSHIYQYMAMLYWRQKHQCNQNSDTCLPLPAQSEIIKMFSNENKIIKLSKMFCQPNLNCMYDQRKTACTCDESIISLYAMFICLSYGHPMVTHKQCFQTLSRSHLDLHLICPV